MSRMRMTDFGVAIIEGDTHLSKTILERGILAVDENCNAVARKYLKPGDTVVDGGACLGDTTQGFLNVVGETGRVIAFEMNPEAYECLKINCPTADRINAALGMLETTALLHPFTDNVGMTWADHCEPGDIDVITLDWLSLSRLNLLKLDIEGMELQAIIGARKTIARCKPILFVELNDVTLARFKLTKQHAIDEMTSLNYRMELSQPEFGLDQAQTEVLFLPNP